MEPSPEYGPKMQALPKETWRNFVMNYIDGGRANATVAWERASSHSMTHEASKVHACRLLHDYRIQEAMLEECQKRLRTLAPAAIAVAEEIMDNPQAAPAARMKAAEFVADRTGLHAVSETKTTVEHIGQDPDQMKRITALAGILGISVEKLLGRRLALQAPVIDVTPVYEPAPAEPVYAPLTTDELEQY